MNFSPVVIRLPPRCRRVSYPAFRVAAVIRPSPHADYRTASASAHRSSATAMSLAMCVLTIVICEQRATCTIQICQIGAPRRSFAITGNRQCICGLQPIDARGAPGKGRDAA